MAPKKNKRVSISALFKKRAAQGKDRGKGVDKLSKVSKVVVPKKQVVAPEHTLAQEFSNKIELSRNEILRDATSAVESTHHMLLERLARTYAQSASFVEEVTVIREELTRPLAQERLQFTGKDGKPSGIALLGDRMKRLKKVAAREEKKLITLWEEWEEVQQSIAGIGKELLGSEAMDTLTKQLWNHKENTPELESKEAAQDIEIEKKKLSKEIEMMSAGIIERLSASEKEMDVRSQKQRQEFLAALGAEY